MTIITIVGARPQFIKSAVLSRAIIEHNNHVGVQAIDEVIIHTGQHFDSNMSDIFFDQLSIPKPKYQLDINGLSHGAMTGQMLENIESILSIERPDFVVVYGDTNSTLAGALAASKMHIPVVHIEAGLRSYNMKMPEEINRILTDRVSTLLFCPTATAISNLKEEGFDKTNCKVFNSGDIMKDSSSLFARYARAPEINLPETFILATVHRAENTDVPERLRGIFKALNEIALKEKIILPLHPRTKKFLEEYNISLNDGIITINPVGYLEMLYLLEACSRVMTDSGGLQKEAFFFKKYCITLRDETEWVELVNNGFNTLTGADYEKIVKAYKTDYTVDFSMNLFGDGNSGGFILNELLNYSIK